jgi:hypothetical protein
MRPLITVRSVVLALSLLLIPATSRATNMITAAVNASGSMWEQSIWRTNLTLGGTFTMAAGNTYTTISNATRFGANQNNTRLRNNITNANNVITFLGDSLTLTTNTDIRFKNITTPASTPLIANFPGVGGNPGLILSGGLLNPGDDGNFFIGGRIQVANQSYLCGGNNGADGGLVPNRRFNISGILSGSGGLYIFECQTNFPQAISNANNTFTGQWIVKNGWLQGATNNSLGTNSITCDPKYPFPSFFSTTAPAVDISTNVSANVRAVVEANYLLNSAGVLTLTNGGMMRLHGVACFSDAIIEGTHLAPGVHYYSDLFANNPTNFDDGGLGANGFGAIVIQPFGTPPLLPPTIQKQPINAFAYADGIARFTVTAADLTGSPLSYQWRSNGVNITSSRFVGATNTMLVISNPAPAEAVNYDVVVSNPSIAVTSSVAALTIVTPTGEAYEAAVRTAKPNAFYQLNEIGDPSTNNSPLYDYAGGYFGAYGAAAQNGFNGVTGPQNSDGPFPGFANGNLAAQTALNTANARMPVLPWNLKTNTVTLTAWINPSGGQNGNEGLVFCRGGTTVAGLGYSSPAGGNALGYNWNNEPDTFNWNSGLTPPPSQWSLVALVVTPTKATVYMLNASGLAASQHVYNHASLAFEGTTLIGDDPAGTGGNRTFNGKIDDVAVFNRELSPSDIMALYSAASGVASFAPQIAVQPVSQTVFQQQTAQFTGLAVGSPPLTYQWLSAPTGSGGPYVNLTDGGQVSGSTTPTLTITSADFANAADYIVIATNSSLALGVASSVANLAINATNAFAINVTMATNEPAGADWDLGLNTPGGNTNWSDLNPASYSAAQSPGNTYELLPGSRLRTPVGPTIATFPGRQLTVDGDGIWRVNPTITDPTSEIRFKQSTYGTTTSGVDGIVNGTVNFPKLRMNGGQLDAGADAGNNINMVIIGGEIDILGNTAFNGDGGNDRGFRVDAFLTGTNNIEYHAYNPATFQSNFVNNLNIACPTNTFSGTWTVVAGTLLGTAPNALGTNHIFVGANGALETTYDMVNTNAYLVLAAGGKMFLHQTNRFRSAVISGVSLAPGTNTYATLSGLFPSNFPAVWAPKIGATSFTTPSGAIVVLSNALPFITVQPRSITNRGQQTATFSVTAVGGLPLRYQWQAGAAGSGVYTNLLNAPNNSGGVTNATLTITNLSAANAGDYIVVVTNSAGAVTSSVARLTDLSAPFITLQPVSTNTSGTLSAQFLASALGDLPMTYQWQAGAIGSGGPYTNVSGSQFLGGTTTNLVINNLAVSNSADFIIIFSNVAGSVTSSVATLLVTDPLITQQPTPAGTLSRYQTASASWSVAILGTAPLASQWQGGVAGSSVFTNMLNGPLVSGATTTTLKLNSVDFPDAGDYRYIVSNPGGAATSSVVSLTVLATSPAQNYTLNFDQGAGVLPINQVSPNDWNTVNQWNPDGEAASTSAEARPGSTYTVVPGARLRTPNGVVSAIFPGGAYTPGIKLIVAGDGVFTNNFTNITATVSEIRFKGNAAFTTNYFKQLVMNGGQLDNGGSPSGMVVIQGEMDIINNAPIYVDAGGGTGRPYRIESWLTGDGNIEYHDFDTTFTGGLNIVGATNTYTGTWHVVQGALIGTGANSLGTNSITVENTGALETAYNLNTPTANLILNGNAQMLLHTADTFRSLMIGNYLVPAGTYTYAQLAGSFLVNFPPSWPLLPGSAVNTASGSITVLVGSPINPITMSFVTAGTNLVFSGNGGIPFGAYYVLSSTNVALAKTNWTRSGPFPFDNTGGFSFTNGITSNPKQQFFQMQQRVP